MPRNPFSEEFFPNIQPIPPLAQLEASSDLAAGTSVHVFLNLVLTVTNFKRLQPCSPIPAWKPSKRQPAYKACSSLGDPKSY